MNLQDVFREFAGEKVYVRKRKPIDWEAVARRNRGGESKTDLAKALGVTRRTVIRRLKPYIRETAPLSF